MQVWPPAVKLQKTSIASPIQPWLGSIQYRPETGLMKGNRLCNSFTLVDKIECRLMSANLVAKEAGKNSRSEDNQP